MPITLNHSNIGVQYNTGSNYIIETVKSDLYLRNEIVDTIVSNNIQTAPVTPSIYIENTSGNIYAVESYTYSGSANTADYTRVFPKNTVCDILVVGGGGAGGKDIGAGGGGGAVLYGTNINIPLGSYNIVIGRGATPGETRGVSSSAFGATLLGGGCAGNVTWSGPSTANSGGSGAGGKSTGSSQTAGGVGVSTKGTILSTATLYNGNIGGTGSLQTAAGVQSAGGGGAGAVGGNGNGSATKTGNGGNGVLVNITGNNLYWGGGGGGGGYTSTPTDGGLGGGGAGERSDGNNVKTYGAVGGSSYNTPVLMNGGVGTGGGGGGSGYLSTNAGSGGSGIVIIRYLLGTIPTNNLLTEPTVISSAFTESIRTFAHSGGTEAQTSYTITVARNTICDILVVGGGGGGGSRHAGGGGAGAVIYSTNITLTAGTYTIGVGKGGTAATTMGQGNKGEDSSISFNSTNIYLAKGGGSGHHDASTGNSNKDGGSGGGSGGTTPGLPVSTNIPSGSYGNSGGSLTDYNGGGGGGGGALTAGTNGTATVGGMGGAGISISITGTAITYGGGGGGGSRSGYTPGTGGVGGGGNGSTTATASSGTAGTGGGGGGGGFTSDGGGNYPGGAGGSGIVIIKFKSLANPITEGNPITHKRLNFVHIPSITYDFTNYNTEATWKAYAATIPNFTYSFQYYFQEGYDGLWSSSEAVGYIEYQLPSSYNNLTVNFGNIYSQSEVRLLINGVLKKTATGNQGNLTHTQSYNAGDVLRIEELHSIMSANIIITLTNTNIYTLNFPVLTLVDINNNNNILLRGEYDISLSTANSSIIPKSNQYIPPPTTFSTSNISIRYNLLNPILDPIGAQWTYNSSNTNVYHMGNVGIGTKSPEYHLDVRGFIHTSVGGYTQTGSENWIIQSDRRIKENIVKASYDKCLENVKNIELYNFNFKDNCVNTNDRHQLGFIAQEVQQVYPKAVEVGKIILDNNQGINDLLTLNTTQIKYTLYGAVKNLIERVENIESRVEQIYNMTLSSNFKSPSSNIQLASLTHQI